MGNERLLRFVKLLLENGLDERVIRTLEATPDFAPTVAKRINGFRGRHPHGADHSEGRILEAVDEMARQGGRVSQHGLGRRLGLGRNTIAERCRNNPKFGKRLKAKMASINGHAK
jgi:hypothetical protein